jgi:hypothetical protein
MKAIEHGHRPRLTGEVDRWVFAIRTSIIGSMIANQVSEHMRDGKGVPNEEDMARFAEEAATVADLWEESLDARG